MDPDDQIFKWLIEGAPAGIREQPLSAGIFPELQEEEPTPYDNIATDFSTFDNYAGIEGDQIAIDEIDAHIAQGHLFATTSLAEATLMLDGEEPILNKIGSSLKFEPARFGGG